jgi:Cu(I)/Ag(I) efflux system membrane protein CusA/SilA
VATVGGMVRQYQVVLDPTSWRPTASRTAGGRGAMQRANQEAGGSVLELGEAEYMVRASGYLKTLDDFRQMPLMPPTPACRCAGRRGRIQVGPEMRRGIAELDGEGEVPAA